MATLEELVTAGDRPVGRGRRLLREDLSWVGTVALLAGVALGGIAGIWFVNVALAGGGGSGCSSEYQADMRYCDDPR